MFPTIRSGDRVELREDFTDVHGNAFVAGQHGECDRAFGKSMWVDFDAQRRPGEALITRGIAGLVPVMKLRKLAA